MRAFTRASVVALVAGLGLASAMAATVTAQSLGDIAKQ